MSGRCGCGCGGGQAVVFALEILLDALAIGVAESAAIDEDFSQVPGEGAVIGGADLSGGVDGRFG